jgi:ATP-dependent DNA helicase RecG
MTPERLRELIAAGECLNVEFKGEEKRRLSDNDLVETVVCLANRPSQETGWLLIGVEDDGRVTGAQPRHEAGHTDPIRIQALIANRTRPSLSSRIDVVPHGDTEVVVVEVPPVRLPVGTADGKYVRRAIGGDGRPACVPFHFHEMQAAQVDRGILDYSSLSMPGAVWEDLDALEFERFRRFIRESRGLGDSSLLQLPDIELAKAVGAVEANQSIRTVRVLGLLMFGRQEALTRLMPTHEVAFQKLSAQRVEVNDFFRSSLLRVMDEIMSRFQARYREEEIMLGMLRIGIPDYPERAFREGLANALIHRDYSRLATTYIQWHDDRIEISNPGGFPEGVRLDNLLVTPPRPRNPLLADAFKRAGIVERTGRGIDTIFYEQLRTGRPAPSYQRSTGTDVVLVLPGGKANLEFARLVAEESQEREPLTLDSLLILNRLWLERQLDIHTAARLIQKPGIDARGALQQLVEAGLVEPRGYKKGRLYHLSASTYRRLGEKAAYVRQRGFEPIQQEQMVLQYIEKHGRITRKETAELCKISSEQAKRLLTRLYQGGYLMQRGQRKGTYYEILPKNMGKPKTLMGKPKK